LSAWCLLQTRLERAGVASRLVIQRNMMDYVRPMGGEFTARSFLEPLGRLDRFLRTLVGRGKARISVGAVLEWDCEICGRLSGEFVAIGSDRG
jgi:thioesterase domain-containing protein